MNQGQRGRVADMLIMNCVHKKEFDKINQTSATKNASFSFSLWNQKSSPCLKVSLEEAFLQIK